MLTVLATPPIEATVRPTRSTNGRPACRGASKRGLVVGRGLGPHQDYGDLRARTKCQDCTLSTESTGWNRGTGMYRPSIRLLRRLETARCDPRVDVGRRFVLACPPKQIVAFFPRAQELGPQSKGRSLTN
jgi:hypothetical protein